MAATLTQDQIGTGRTFGEDKPGAFSALDGLVEVSYDRVESDYKIDENTATFPRKRAIQIKYEPPGNASEIDFYGAGDKTLWVRRIVPSGAGSGTFDYKCRVCECIHNRVTVMSGYQDQYLVILKVIDLKVSSLPTGG